MRRILFGLLCFGALSAGAGGVLGIAANGAGVPLSYLEGTGFTSYAVPGLLLGLVVGGTQLAAALAVRTTRYLLLASTAGAGMLIWIFVELAVLGEYSFLQTIYFGLGGAQVGCVLIILGVLRPVRFVAITGRVS